MSPLGLAWRSLTRQPARAVLGVIGIAAVAALLWDMLLLSRGLVRIVVAVMRGSLSDVAQAISAEWTGAATLLHPTRKASCRRSI